MSRAILLAIALVLIALGLAEAQTVGPAPIYCNRVYATTTLSASTTQLVAGVSGKAVSFCGFNADGLAAGTFQFVFGTGTSCTTSTAATGVITTAAGDNIIDHTPSASVSGAAGQSLCAIITGTSAVTITTYYGIN
jgi:hypothetical protein